jgi:probable rRNA maturation factor
LTVLVTDEQDDEPPLAVDGQRWAALARAALRDAAFTNPAELTVAFVDEAAMADLNQRFMGAPGPTDVLAFPLDAATDSDDPTLTEDLPRLLGDVVICPAVAARNASEHAGSYDDEIALLLVHGILHLLGMDHDTDASRVAMQARERAVLHVHHGELARDPWQ